MAKRAKQHDSDEDDDMYLKVKQEMGSNKTRQKSIIRQDECKTPASETCTPTRRQKSEGTPCLEKLPKETKSAFNIVRKHEPFTPLYKTAIGMISSHVLATETQQPEMNLEKQVFENIEKELSRKHTSRTKTTLIIEHVRAELCSTLARNLANVIENGNDLDKALLAVRSAAKARIPGIVKCHPPDDLGKGSTGSKRKRVSSDVGTSMAKVMKLDEDSSSEDGDGTTAQPASCANGLESKQVFNLETFLTIRARPNIVRIAKRFFADGEDLFNFQLQQLQGGSEHEASSLAPLRWSELSEKQQQEWQQLLKSLHKGSKLPVTGGGRELMERHRASFVPSTSAKDDPNSASTSSSDDSESTDDESDDGESDNDRIDGTGRDVDDTRVNKLGEVPPSASHSEYVPDSHEAAKIDGLPKNLPWTEEEKRVLLKGMYYGWSNEKIASELPQSTRKRTPQAVSCQRSNMKRRHPNGVPVIRADTPFPFSSGASTIRTSREQSSLPERRSMKDKKGNSGTADASCMAEKRKLVPSVAKPIRTSVDMPEPTFIQYRARPPVTAETENLEYLLLPIETPECPVTDATSEDVTNACAQAFGKWSAFKRAEKLDNVLWIAIFQRRGTLPLPQHRLREVIITFRGHQFRAGHLSYKPPRTFVADITPEPVMITSNLVAAIQATASNWSSLPKVFLQAMIRPGQNQSRRIMLQFAANPGIMQFYIPVKVGSSQRWVHVRFEPLDLVIPCWLCGISHGGTGLCDRAIRLPYSSR